MREETFHAWEADGKRYRAVYDETYETRGSYAYDTEEETRAAEDDEIGRLEAGALIVIRIIVSEFRKAEHCKSCTCEEMTWQEADSLWGIVIEPDNKKIEEFAREGM